MPSKQQRYIINRLVTNIENSLQTVHFALLREPTEAQAQQFRNYIGRRGSIEGKRVELVAIRDQGKIATVWEALTALFGREPTLGDI